MPAAIATAFASLDLLAGVRYAGNGLTNSTVEGLCRHINQNGNVISVLSVRAAAALPSGSSVTVDILVNGVPTSCSVTITSADGTNLKQDFAHYYVPALYDGISFRATPSGGILGNINLACSVSGG